MKIPKIFKLFILIILMITSTGCNNNYISLNDMAIVSSLLIDKNEKDEYVTYIELYKEEKSENKSKKVSYFVKGTASNIKDAINNAASSISKNLYFVHINALIFSKEIAQTNLNDIFNYLESRVQLNSNYYILVADNIKELMKSKDNDNPILGEKINNLIKYSTNNGTMVNYDVMEKLKNYISPNKDIYLNNVEVKDDNITIKNGYYFDDSKLVGKLTNEELKLINLFKNTKNLYFTFKYNNEEYNLKVNQSKVKYKIKDKININLDIKLNIEVAGQDIIVNKTKEIEKLNKHTEKSLEKRLTELITKLKTNKSDILGINNYIYKIYGKKILDFEKDDFKVNVNVEISKRGLIQKTLGGTHEKK